MSQMKTGTLIIAAMLATVCAAPVLACTPSPNYVERRQEYEDQGLRRATVLFRGIIENYQQPDGRYGNATMEIRRTQTFWGRGEPDRLAIPWEYFVNCAHGNLHAAVDQYGEHPGLPVVRNGLGVTLLGRLEDASAPWDFIILVDNAPDTQRVLRRFQELKRAQ
ncbi:hypothetical protein EGK63_00185 [Brevundimonas sp. 357]|nr:hypothetical protein EGK63_00185 [Brevundimonas sp. 357]